MSPKPSLPGNRPVTIALCLMLASLAVAVLCAATAHAADYKMLLCAGNNGSNSFQTATNTAYSKYPSGIFNFENYCGPAPDPAGNNAFLRIRDVAADGTAAETAYGSISWTAPPWVAILQAGGYTREPSAFNQGWRARFWLEGFDGSTNNTLMQGSGVDNGSCGGICWATTSTFGSHVWPFTSLGYYRRFVFEVTCFRPAGCDRSGENIADANTMTLTLNDVQSPDLYFLAQDSSLMQGKWVKGSQWVPWYVHDNGSGIREEWVALDGAARHALDHGGEVERGLNLRRREVVCDPSRPALRRLGILWRRGGEIDQIADQEPARIARLALVHAHPRLEDPGRRPGAGERRVVAVKANRLTRVIGGAERGGL